MFNALKFGFSEKATKFEKNRHRTFDKSVVFSARNSVLVKKSTKIFFLKMWTSRIIQTLIQEILKNEGSGRLLPHPSIDLMSFWLIQNQIKSHFINYVN